MQSFNNCFLGVCSARLAHSCKGGRQGACPQGVCSPAGQRRETNIALGSEKGYKENKVDSGSGERQQ